MLSIEFPNAGWKQFLLNKKSLLDSFDHARGISQGRKVLTSHGLNAEAGFRKWLEEFLPKRYGVTSGFVVSPGMDHRQVFPHFDVIVYDRLNSPTLWIEGTTDQSKQGELRAIPAEHVLAVLEVKSALSAKTSREAVKHLSELAPLMSGTDKPTDPYKLHLPMQFSCGVVFFELRSTEDFSPAVLNNLLPGTQLRGFSGGVVLRSERHADPNVTGRLRPWRSRTARSNTTGKGKTSLFNFGMSKSVHSSGDFHDGVLLSWGETFFAEFAFDLIAQLSGSYKVGMLSNFLAMGTAELERASLAGE